MPRVSAPEFPWLAAGPRRKISKAEQTAEAERRAGMYRAEMLERASLLNRLGYSAKRATARLRANLAWDFEQANGERPSGLSDREIGEIVKTAYQRRANR